MKIKEELSLHLVEYSPEWENTSHNLHFLSRLLKNDSQADIIILPEMFNTGFSMDSSGISEKMSGPTINWMKEISLLSHSAVCGSLAIEEDHC
jgi:predicted amidohydrolase